MVRSAQFDAVVSTEQQQSNRDSRSVLYPHPTSGFRRWLLRARPPLGHVPALRGRRSTADIREHQAISDSTGSYVRIQLAGGNGAEESAVLHGGGDGEVYGRAVSVPDGEVRSGRGGWFGFRER